MSDLYLGVAAAIALVCAGYLLVRYEIIGVKDAAASVGLIAGVAFIWRKLTKKKEPSEPVRPPDKHTPDPVPPTRDVERAIAESDKTLTAEPPDDIHDKLKDALKKYRD